MIKVVKRTQMSAGKRALLQLLSIVLALVLTGLLLLLLKYNSIAVYREMFYGALGSLYRVQQTINKMIPLLIMGLGLSVCFRSQFMNIGSEGQFYMGAIGATFAIRLIGDRLGALTLPTMMLFSFILGGLWCLLPALLKRYYGVSETLVTLLLNYIAIRIVSYLQYSVWKDPEAYGFPKIANYPTAALLTKVFGVHIGWIIALILVAVIYFLLFKSKLGYEMAVMGDNLLTARYAGMNTSKILLASALIGGGLCGLSGMIQASGIERTMNDQMSSGMGFTAIIVAYMSRLNPLALVVGSFLFAVLLQGGEYIQSSLQISSDIAQILQGMILICVLSSEFFTEYKLSLRHKTGDGELAHE
jgi:ABC-type uncharacterized transport system permease subunit